MPSPSQVLLLGASAGLSYDADALAYFNATGLTDITKKAAINSYIVGLKADSLWAGTKLRALYIFPGNTATINKYNLKDPQDTDAAFRLLYNSVNFTHGTNGVAVTNSSTADFIDTRLNPSTVYPTYAFSYGALNHVIPSVNNTGGVYFGGNAGGSTLFNMRRGTSATEQVTFADGNSRTSTGITLLEFWACSHNGTTAQVYKDGVATGGTISVTTGSRPNQNMYLMRQNNNGSPQGTSLLTMKFAFWGDFLTATEIGNLHTRTAALQAALGR